MINTDNIYILTRQELNNKGAYQFKDGDVIVCNKYRIWIKYENFKRPSILTTVSTETDLRDLPIRKQPQYIREFIGRIPEELESVV